MSYLRLLLGVTREAPQTGRDNPAIPFEDTGFGLLRAKVFERDRYVCQFCGFTSNKYQDILPRPPSRQDNGAARGANRIDSLATACIFCHQCAKLEIVPKMQSGVLIWLPEISQAALHHVMRAIYVARRTQGPMADAARGALDALLERRVDCKRRIGTDDPVVLSAIMQDLLEEKYYRKRGEKLDGVRLLPLDRRIITDDDLEFDQFPQILAYWRSKNGPFGGVMPLTWPHLLKSVQESLAE